MLDIFSEIAARGLAICLLGGILGVLLSHVYYVLPQEIQQVFRWESSRQLELLALGLSFVAGIVASFVPAYEAIKVNPVEALQEQMR